MELDFAQAFGRSLVEQERIIVERNRAPIGGIFSRVEEIILHELADELHVDMHCAFQLGRPATSQRHMENGVLFKALGGNDVPEQIDHFFGLQSHFHFAGWIIEQITAVIFACIAEIIGGPALIELHSHSRSQASMKFFFT